MPSTSIGRGRPLIFWGSLGPDPGGGGMHILVVAAHPDDETLGAGGTMAWHAARGDHVYVCILTDGASSRHQYVELQADCARRACDTLGVKQVVLVGLPDQRL